MIQEANEETFFIVGEVSRCIMAAFLALVATILTSFLPILNKRILRDARPALVAWIVNAASLPLLALGTELVTQCSLSLASRGMPFSCSTHLPHIDGIFVAALLASVALNFTATLLSTYALAQADASLVSPLLTFNPAFTLLAAWFTLGETPGARQTIGVGLVLFGAYLLEVEQARTGLLAPLQVLFRRAGALLAVIASALWGATTVLEKLAIEHVTPPSGPFVALVGTALMVVLLTPGAFFASLREGTPARKGRWSGLRAHPGALTTAIVLAGTAPLFGFTAIALGLVGYVTALFKLSSVLTIIWAWLFLGEGQIRQRLLGTSVMLLGGMLVALF